MEFYKVKNIILDEWFKSGSGPKSDEPKWAKDLEKELQWYRLTTSNDAEYTYYVSEIVLDSNQFTKVDKEEVVSVYELQYPDYMVDKSSGKKLTLTEISIANPETLKTITFAEQVNVDKEIENRLNRWSKDG